MTSGESHEPIAIAVQHYPTKMVYWSDNTAHVIRRKSLDGDGDVETFYRFPPGKDFIHLYIYLLIK